MAASQISHARVLEIDEKRNQGYTLKQSCNYDEAERKRYSRYKKSHHPLTVYGFIPPELQMKPGDVAQPSVVVIPPKAGRWKQVREKEALKKFEKKKAKVVAEEEAKEEAKKLKKEEEEAEIEEAPVPAPAVKKVTKVAKSVPVPTLATDMDYIEILKAACMQDITKAKNQENLIKVLTLEQKGLQSTNISVHQYVAGFWKQIEQAQGTKIEELVRDPEDDDYQEEEEE